MLPAERKYHQIIRAYSLILPGSLVSFLVIALLWFAFPSVPVLTKALSLMYLFSVASSFVILSPLALVAANKVRSTSARILAAFPATYFVAIPLAAWVGAHGDPGLCIAILLSYIGATMLLGLTMSMQTFREAHNRLKEPVVVKLGCHQAHGITQLAVSDDEGVRLTLPEPHQLL